jgi:hypothetical protein
MVSVLMFYKQVPPRLYLSRVSVPLFILVSVPGYVVTLPVFYRQVLYLSIRFLHQCSLAVTECNLFFLILYIYGLCTLSLWWTLFLCLSGSLHLRIRSQYRRSLCDFILYRPHYQSLWRLTSTPHSHSPLYQDSSHPSSLFTSFTLFAPIPLSNGLPCLTVHLPLVSLRRIFPSFSPSPALLTRVFF